MLISHYLQALPIMRSSSDFDDRYVKAASYTSSQPRGEFDERHRASVQALFATDPADDMHMIANKKDKLLDTTESWIMKDPTYIKWLQDSRSLVLWLHGDPGKGKTMLAIALIEEFSRKLRMDKSARNTALVYFFCDNQDDRRRTASLILRGLIYQILCQHPDLAVYLHNEYEKQREQLFSSPNSLHTCWRIFQTIISYWNSLLVIIVVWLKNVKIIMMLQLNMN